MSFSQQEISEGIRTSHEFNNNKRRLKRPRSRDSQHGDHLGSKTPPRDAADHLHSGILFFLSPPNPTLIHPNPDLTFVVPYGVLTLGNKRLLSQVTVVTVLFQAWRSYAQQLSYQRNGHLHLQAKNHFELQHYY